MGLGEMGGHPSDSSSSHSRSRRFRRVADFGDYIVAYSVDEALYVPASVTTYDRCFRSVYASVYAS